MTNINHKEEIRRMTNLKKIVIGVIIVLLLCSLLVLRFEFRQQANYTYPTSERVVIVPEGGQHVLVDVLTVMRGKLPEADVVPLLKKYGGTITVEVPETGTYAVRFPVTNLDQLKYIKKELVDHGLWAVESIVIPLPNPNGPQ